MADKKVTPQAPSAEASKGGEKTAATRVTKRQVKRQVKRQAK